jgi:hypothetical protein
LFLLSYVLEVCEFDYLLSIEFCSHKSPLPSDSASTVLYFNFIYPVQVLDIFATGSGFGFLCNINSDEASGYFCIFWSHPYICSSDSVLRSTTIMLMSWGINSFFTFFVLENAQMFFYLSGHGTVTLLCVFYTTVWCHCSYCPIYTSEKKGFHSSPLVPNQFDPRLKGPSVPVHLKMWARGH